MKVMKAKFKIFLGTTLLLFISAHSYSNKYNESRSLDEIEQSDTITLNSIKYTRQNGILTPINSWSSINNRVTFQDTMFYNPIFLPIVFDGQILPSNLDFIPKDSVENLYATPDFHLLSPDSTLLPILERRRWEQKVKKRYYTTSIPFVKYNIFTLKGIKSIDNPTMLSPLEFKDNIGGKKPDYSTKIQVKKYVPGQIYWTKSGEHSLQVNQTQYSGNWYSSGYSNYSVANYHKILLNYKKDKISWNNTIEWKLDFQKTPADSLHKLSITSDYIRTYSVVGVSLTNKKWSYTLTNEIKTPLFTSYKVNTAAPTTALLSPLTITTGVGLTYSLAKTYKSDKNKKLTLTLDLSPLSLNFTLVRDTMIDETAYGVAENQKSDFELGSTYNVNFTYAHSRNSTFTSRLKYFTSYSKVIVESENKYTFSFTRLLSSTIYLYLRYDDGVGVANKDDKIGYFQYNELVGFGLSYTW